MTTRRVARRVASRFQAQNSRRYAGNSQMVETKVLHCSLPSLLGRGRAAGGLRIGVEQGRSVRRERRSRSVLAGVWSLLIPTTGARRVAWTPAPRPTPFPSLVLATKQSKEQVPK